MSVNDNTVGDFLATRYFLVLNCRIIERQANDNVYLVRKGVLRMLRLANGGKFVFKQSRERIYVLYFYVGENWRFRVNLIPH